MVFTSSVFLFLFLTGVLATYYLLPLLLRQQIDRVPLASTILLTVASYGFYGWERYWYVFLIAASTIIDLNAAAWMARARSIGRRKLFLWVSVVSNLGLLGYFKYRNFAVDSVNTALESWGMDGFDALSPELVLPVGISFYTFQTMSYTIDVYRGRVKPVGRAGIPGFICYVALFPQLVAGPIVRFRDVAEQLIHRTHSVEKFGAGVFFFMVGFAKKTLIANQVGVLSDSLAQTAGPGLIDAWCGVVAYTLQIYFDFSGYSDMAIGLGLMFGFEFPFNFNAPYKSRSITDFWRRWHISLSTWLRDYLYIPLGGNQKGAIFTYRNLLITMLLGGLWHGAAWTFVLWGAWHGGWLALERLMRNHWRADAMPAALRQAWTMLIVMIGWVFFSAESMAQANDVLSGLFAFNGLGSFTLRGPTAATLPLIVLCVGSCVALFARTTQDLARRMTLLRAVAALIAFCLGLLAMIQSGFNPFLYYQF